MTLKRVSIITLLLALVVFLSFTAIEMGWMNKNSKVVIPPGITFYKNTQTLCIVGFSEKSTGEQGYEVAVLVRTKSEDLTTPVFQEYPPQKKYFWEMRDKAWNRATTQIFMDPACLELPIDNNITGYLLIIRPLAANVEDDENWKVWELDLFVEKNPRQVHIPNINELKALESRKDSKQILDMFQALLRFCAKHHWVD